MGRLTCLVIGFVLCAAIALGQTDSAALSGRVTDASGAVLPGVSVTLTGPSLLQPQVAATSETGSFQFPRLNVGTYNVKFELPGFKTVVKEGIQVTVGFNANVSTALSVSSVQETVTVTGESPIVDTKQTGTKQTFTLEQRYQTPPNETTIGIRLVWKFTVPAGTFGNMTFTEYSVMKVAPVLN